MSGLLFLLCFGGVFALIVLSVISSIFRRLWSGNQPTYYGSGYKPPPRNYWSGGGYKPSSFGGHKHSSGYEHSSSSGGGYKHKSSSSSYSSKPKSFGGPKWSSGGKKGGGAKGKW